MATLAQHLPKLDEAHDLPLYQQLQRALREAIEKRVLGPDDALPPERDLADDLSVSRITVRKAIDGLVDEGLLVRRQGAGTFVCARVEKNFAKLTSFSEDMRARGRKPRSVWLNRAAGTVTPEEALTLRSSPGTPVYRFHRIRYADDAPMALEYATVLASCLPSIETVESSLYEALEKNGSRPVRALQRLRAVLFTSEQAKLLKAQERDAGLLVERLGFLKDGRAVEFSQSYYRGDRLALGALVHEGVEPSSIILYGESLGTGIAVRLAAERQVAGVVLDAPYTSLVDVAAGVYPFLPVRLALADRYESSKYIKQVHAPLLILHGERDEVIPVAMGRELFRLANEPKRLAVFPNGGHSDLYLDGNGALEAMRSWVNELRRATAP